MASLRYLVTLTLILFVFVAGNFQGQARTDMPASASTAVSTPR